MMRSKIFAFFAVCLFLMVSANAQTVNEAESSIVLNDKTADVSLVVENPNKTSTGKVTLELLDQKDIVQSQVTVSQQFKQGREIYKLNLPLNNLLEKNQADIIWFRLRYRLGESRGIISVSEIVKDIFELRVIASSILFSGMTYRTRIRAVHPLKNEIVQGVKINAELALENKEIEKTVLTAQGETDDEGFADLDFQIPQAFNLEDADIKITGQKNGVRRETKENLSIQSDDFQFPIMTDKPIYQPEQMLNVRGILLRGTVGKVVVPNSELEFRITDEDNTVLYREKVKTSEFGIAAMSWKIPENAKLGSYRIQVRNSEDNYIGDQSIKISRYDLPNFAVSAKALKPYYLPDENKAEVEVNADYLFGKPVTKGKVRVVRENERTWSYKEQKYDIDEGESHEGKADESGKYTATFDLSDEHKKLKDKNYSKLRDLNFTAYFTDLTTNRTEQRRFDVRVTKEAIHVYFIGEHENYNADLPVKAFVSAFYADGSPCLCEVEVKGRKDDSDEKFKTLQKLKTNSLGGGKLNFMRPKFDDFNDDLEIRIFVKDKNGLQGTFGSDENWRDKLDFGDKDKLEIIPDKTVFKPGESVKIKLNTAFEKDTENYSPKVYIDIVKNFSVIESYFTTLEKGKGELKIPSQPSFQGEIIIAAYFQKDNEINGDLVKTSRGIIFPFSENLKLEATFDKESYKPSEEAKVSFNVVDSLGQAVNSALGVVIFDKAVEERARTEGEFGGTFRAYYSWLGYGDSFGGINVKDLNELDLSKPISDEIQLAAEIMLYDENYHPNIFSSKEVLPTDAKSVYSDYFKKQFDPIEKKLKTHYELKFFEHPTDDASFRKILNLNEISFDDLRDPWEQKYRAVFRVEKAFDVVNIRSSGADKKFDTDDDFTVSSLSFLYFAPTAKAIDKAVKDFHARTGDYIRDEKTLFRELGITELKDRFNHPYQINFYVDGKYIKLRIWSSGENGKTLNYDYYDDFEVYSGVQNYFQDTEKRVNQILSSAKKILSTEDELKTLLKENGVDLDNLRDSYGEKVYLFKRTFVKYTNVYKEEIISEYGKEETTKREIIVPVTQVLISFQVRSKGADKKENTADDFTLAEFANVISEQTKDDKKPVMKPIIFKDGAGSISGVVKDTNGAVIPAVTVTATNSESLQSKSAATDENGIYFIGNLTTGNYNVRASVRVFKDSVRSNVPITVNSITTVDFIMQLGNVSSVVTITAESASVDTSSAQVQSNVTKTEISELPINGRDFSQFVKLQPGTAAEEESEQNSSQKSTPKLREYFPETLVWQPELITNANGKAELKFKMADNITTWKLYTIASTKNGKIGVAEKEVQAFQPFFVDLDPPKFLTAGDEIYLPTQVRNYTPKKQKVDVTMSKSDWFSFLDSDKKQIEVDKNSAGNAIFGFKAITPIKDGKQRVTAIAVKDSDAIEKPVTVRPNGEEMVRTESKLFTNSAQFEVNFPENMLPKTNKAELKIYPNLMSHVTESVEGLLQRPYGCGEQTISSTYPNLMLLKFIKTNNSLTKQAKKYLKVGYERLLGYQVADGGFSYWGGKDESNLALTAYALRFLNDAKSFIEVDENVVEKAANYLIKLQRPDGSFYKKYTWETTEDNRRVKMSTTYIARTLAMLKTNKPSLDKALSYLKIRNAEIDEPYSLALYALANFDAGNFDEAEKTARRLRILAKEEGNTVYWNLETNTPFYCWGTAGRIETTALVLQVLLKSKDQNEKDLISKTTMFLLKSKDRYGVWYSTQTTINVLDAFLASLSESKAQTISVSINGEKLQDFAVSADQIEPIIFSLNDKLAAANSLNITSSDSSPIMSQIVQTHYIDWKDSVSTNRNVNDSRAIRLDYKCDKYAAKIMETINCAVEAERIRFSGYGMLLAEIGIPPGANVSRESLEEAFKNDWSLSRYDILPDRIVVYMWAKAGGSKFNFSFNPRYGINAKTPASKIYDYYNEESKGVAAPLNFMIK